MNTLGMADRDKKLSVYVTEQRKEEIRRRADSEDMTISSYLNQLIQRQLVAEEQNEISAQTQAVEQLQKTIDQGTRQLRDVATDIKNIQARTGTYAVANFELLKEDYPESRINEATTKGSQILAGEAPFPDESTDDDDEGNPFAHRDDDDDTEDT